jgi:ATP-binding cassette subfamily G (WHITE) protein 2 (SNQ2)
MGSLLTFTMWDAEVVCTSDEYGRFDPPSGQTCAAYMADFLSSATGYLNNPVRQCRSVIVRVLITPGRNEWLRVLRVQQWT